MQTPSPLEIEREVATLRDIRRRSSQQGPGSIPLDPDLPPGGVASASAGGYWDSYGQEQSGVALTGGAIDDLGSETTGESDTAASDDPSHLFWVPAHLHPELAPGEFRAFLKEHTSAHPDGMGAMPRTLSHSLSGSKMGRKKSMLSKQYRPAANDNVEDETVVTVKRNRSSIYSSAGPTLTIGDLQKLEELAEEAAKSDDPSKLRSMLRRSLSLNVAPSFIDQMDDISEGDDADSPIIIPRPGQILRRSARTKIRKVNLPGDGGGHRFPASRRSARHKDDDPSSSENGHDTAEPVPSSIRNEERPVSYSEEAFILDAYGERRDSMTSTRSSMEDSDEMVSAQSHSTLTTTAPSSMSQHAPVTAKSPTSPQPDPSISPPRGQTIRRISPPPGPPQVEQPLPALRHPVPQHQLEVPQPQGGVPSRTPSPTEPQGNGRLTPSPTPDPFHAAPSPSPPLHAPQPLYPGGGASSEPNSARASPAPSIRSTKSAKEKEKKGLLKGMWGGDKKKEREKNEREKAESASRENREREGKEKEGGFFGSLFGGKKKHDESEQHQRGGLLSGAGPAAAAALLGASAKKQAREPSPGPGGLQTSFARYPIHVERAVYRLSHIKLANPRRPLYEQVLISNLMFWYLGVINKVTTPTPAPSATPATNASGAAISTSGDQEEKDHTASEREKAEKEKMEREREEKERAAERERQEAEARDRERSVEKESRKRGTLVKSPPPGSGGGRRAEMPVRGPQYDVQHQMMEQERGGGGPAGHHGHGGRQMQRSNSAGPIPSQDPHHRRGNDPHYDPRSQQQHGRPPHPNQQPPYNNQAPSPYSPQYQQQQPYGTPQQPYTVPPNQQPSPAGGYTQFAPSLPPGAMAPPPPPSDQWLGPATSRDSPYAAAGGGPGPSVPGQTYPAPVNPPRSSSKGPYPNGPGPGGSANGPPPRLVGRSVSATAASGGGGGPQAPNPGRQQRQQGPPQPVPVVNGAGGGWQTQDRGRRGPSPQPPPAGERIRSNSSAGIAMDDVPLAYQQQNSRGNPILR